MVSKITLRQSFGQKVGNFIPECWLILFTKLKVQWKFPFTTSTHKMAMFACWHAWRRMNKPLRIEDCCQGEAAPITNQCVMCYYAWISYANMWTKSAVKCCRCHYLDYRQQQCAAAYCAVVGHAHVCVISVCVHLRWAHCVACVRSRLHN